MINYYLSKLVTYIVFIIMGLLFGNMAIAKDEIIIATDVPYYPMEYETPDGTLEGFDVDMGNAICKLENLECRWEAQPWDSIIPGIAVNKYDISLSSMGITEARSKQVAFSKPYINSPAYLYAPVDTEDNDSVDALIDGKTVGIQRGTVYDDYLSAEFKGKIKMKRYADVDSLVVDLLADRVDFVLLDAITGKGSVLDVYPDKLKKVGPTIMEEDYFGIGFGAAFNKNNQTLLDSFNRGLETIVENGQYHEIYTKYFGDGDAPDAVMPPWIEESLKK